MAGRGRLEGRALRARQIDNLAAPAITDDPPRCNLRVLLLNRLDELGNALGGFRGRGGRLEEVAELLSLFVRVRGIPGDVGGGALEEVGHEDAVLVRAVGVGKQVGALQRLWEVAEDVVDEEDGLRG